MGIPKRESYSHLEKKGKSSYGFQNLVGFPMVSLRIFFFFLPLTVGKDGDSKKGKLGKDADSNREKLGKDRDSNRGKLG